MAKHSKDYYSNNKDGSLCSGYGVFPDGLGTTIRYTG